MREIVPYKIDTKAKNAIINCAIEGKTLDDTVDVLLRDYGVDVSRQTVWVVRTKNAKRIAAVLENQLDRAIAVSPIATLENRMLVLERVIKEGFDDYEKAVNDLNSDEELNPEQEAMLRMKGIRSLQAVNDAIKIADSAMNRMLTVQQKMREYQAKNNLGTRDMVEETILTVQKRVYQADDKRVQRKSEMADLVGEVEWIEDDDLDD